jgi:DNA polymerase-3 subunit delta'
MARMYLCGAGKGNDDCAGCAGWSSSEDNGTTHPDLIVAGSLEKAANIDACRALLHELPMKPVVSERRLGVVPAADRLLVAAANSLLKIAEEPPSHACILFLMEGDDFLPTLRSRSRFTVLAAPPSSSVSPMPAGDAEWLSWLEGLKTEGAKAEGSKGDADISAVLSGWVSYAVRGGRDGLKMAARMERLRLLVEQKKLSQNMVCDLLILALREDLPFEHIFGGFW